MMLSFFPSSLGGNGCGHGSTLETEKVLKMGDSRPGAVYHVKIAHLEKIY
jgi:hypothetical protein